MATCTLVVRKISTPPRTNPIAHRDASPSPVPATCTRSSPSAPRSASFPPMRANAPVQNPSPGFAPACPGDGFWTGAFAIHHQDSPLLVLHYVLWLQVAVDYPGAVRRF